MNIEYMHKLSTYLISIVLVFLLCISMVPLGQLSGGNQVDITDHDQQTNQSTNYDRAVIDGQYEHQENIDNLTDEEQAMDETQVVLHETDTSDTEIQSTGVSSIESSTFDLSTFEATTFVAQWDTTLTSTGSSSSTEITLPLESTGNYNFVVDWNDTNSDTITSYNQAEVTHTYTSPGIYNITISGTLDGWRFNYGGDRLKITEIAQWGNISIGNSGQYFSGTENLKLTATDAPDLSGTTTLYQAFRNSYNLGDTGDMNTWNISSVTTLTEMFRDATSFNLPIGNWNVSSVTSMPSMFRGASSFNQPIGSWNVSSVIYMHYMFAEATSFNQPIGNWNVSSVNYIYDMFNGATSFNQPIGNWNVSSVTDMGYMFYGATSFNQPIGNWDISSVNYIYDMFNGATSFNQPIGNWNVSSVTNLGYMFYGASSFNQPLENWNVSSVTDMRYMFYNASSFIQPIANWNVSSVTEMEGMFDEVTLSISIYDDLLLGWSTLSLQQGVTFSAGFSQFSTKGVEDKFSLVEEFGWIISDGGLFIDDTSPELDNTQDFTYEINTTGNTISWTVGDSYPDFYNVYLDDAIFIDDTEWTNGSITVNVDGLDIGKYVITLYVYDISGNVAFDSVVVTVTDSSGTPPENEVTITETEMETITETETETNPLEDEEENNSFLPISNLFMFVSLVMIITIHRFRNRNN